jgi:short-subunit dehydrogenase
MLLSARGNKMKLQGKLFLLTGATGGIGKAIAQNLAAQGASLMLVGRSTVALQALAAGLTNSTTENVVVSADITTQDGREQIRRALCTLHQPLAGLINCAGVNAFSWLEDTDPKTIENVINTNVTATILLTRLVLPFLDDQGGRIVTIGSSFGGLGYPGFSVYCASKFALRGFSEALRRELSGGGIQVAYLAPRATQTQLNSDAVCAMNRELGNAMDKPYVVAGVLLNMLLRKNMGDRNIGWPERLFLRINSLLPRIIDSALREQLPVIRRYAKADIASVPVISSILTSNID